MGEPVYVCSLWKEDFQIISAIFNFERGAHEWKDKQPEHLYPEITKVILNKEQEWGW